MAAAVDGAAPKRRKVRKGTQSCWECRRRKVRCIFAATTDASCENCRRRRMSCLSQELPDEPTMPAPRSGGQVEARLGRVEALVERLVDGAGTVRDISSSPAEEFAEIDLTQLETRSLAGGASENCTGEPTDPRSPSDQSAPAAAAAVAAAAAATSPAQSRRAPAKYEELARALIAAWPSQGDIDIICSLPVGISAHYQIGICTLSSSSSTGGQRPSSRQVLQLPPPGSHPVLIARKLLLLGMYLQGLPPSAIQDLRGDVRALYRDMMSRVVDTAVRLVTSNDDLIGSVEGIDCIMIEAMYQNYIGNLHRAWMATRRAITVAQMMALHRGLSSPSLKILDPETRAVFDPDQICLRLVEMDGYLSLMLGLPRTSLEARFATARALEECQPIDRLPRVYCVITERILQRDENDLSETREIDTLLQEAAAEMPPQWWLIPNLSVGSRVGGTEVLQETTRLMFQFARYHLLIRLHLPYMLRPSPDSRYDQSKITAVNASREILARFVAFHTSNPTRFYCHGIDYFAFIATTVLCLAHMDSRSGRQGACLSVVSNSLAHSRPSDRGMIEHTLDIIESMARDGNDAICFGIARILRPLLVVEANAASGTIYSTNFSKGDQEELEYHGKLTNGGKGLHVHIPYIGTINFEPRAVSKPVPTAPTTSKLGVLTPLITDVRGEHAQQSQPSPDYSPAYSISRQADHHHAQMMQRQSGQSAPSQQPPSPSTGAPVLSSGNSQNDLLPASEEFTDADFDWDLQGVDVALFDSLFRGSAMLDVADDGNWAQWAGGYG